VTAITVAPGESLTGRLSVPGDKSISHRVVMLAAMADGTSEVVGLSDGADVANTLSIIEALGAGVEVADEVVRITGGCLRPAGRSLHVGNSGTAMRLLSGMLAGLAFTSELDGDESIRRRPMGRVIDPLREMGATISGVDGSTLAPLTIDGGGLHGIEYVTPMASAQVKGCVLFAGLSATSPTTVVESAPTRAHTEELMAASGIEVTMGPGSVTVQPGRPAPLAHRVAGDPSQAAFWAVAAAVVAGSEVIVENVYAGPVRTGFVNVLARMGADITHDLGTGDLTVRASDLEGTVVEATEVPGLVDEVPVLAVAAACADGETRFCGVGELRVKETDRLATTTSELGAMGARVTIEGDDLVVSGGSLRGTEVDSHGDHRIAMACAVAALVAEGPTVVSGWEAVDTSYPSFERDLESLRT